MGFLFNFKNIENNSNNKSRFLNLNGRNLTFAGSTFQSANINMGKYIILRIRRAVIADIRVKYIGGGGGRYNSYFLISNCTNINIGLN